MARNVLIVIGLIVLGVLVFCLCCYKVNHNQASFIELINLIFSCVLVTDQGYLHKNQISLHF